MYIRFGTVVKKMVEISSDTSEYKIYLSNGMDPRKIASINYIMDKTDDDCGDVLKDMGKVESKNSFSSSENESARSNDTYEIFKTIGEEENMEKIPSNLNPESKSYPITDRSFSITSYDPDELSSKISNAIHYSRTRSMSKDIKMMTWMRRLKNF